MDNETRKKLAQDLPANAVKTREQGGQRLSYIDGHFAITRANDVFGHDGWSAAVRSVSEVYRGTRPGRDGENIVIVYEAHVAVTALGITREDVGIGQCDASLKALAQGIEKGRKEAVTDGLKRALRTFGASFGLALYDKAQTDVGASFEAQEALAAIDSATDDASLDAADAMMRRLWPSFSGEECDAVEAAMKRAVKRIRKPAPKAAPTVAAPPQIEAATVASLGIEKPASPPAGDWMSDVDAITKDQPGLVPFAAAMERANLPGECVDAWMKHRAELAAFAADVREKAWRLLCRRCESVGKMKDGAGRTWLKRSIAERDAKPAEAAS